MEKILVAVGSTRRPKVNAVTEALASIRNLFENSPEFEVVGMEVASGVRHTPLTREDLMAGARQRAEALARVARASGHAWKYFVGLEGGFDVIPGLDAMPSLDVMPELDVVREAEWRWVFLESWAYVADEAGRGAFGRSGSVPVPSVLAARVVDDGIELSEAIDAFANGHNIRDAEGAWGIFTRNLITRQESFRVAVINAFAPFFNRAIYLKE
ncbi:MAG: inosine/xanthosine triphosphatase [Candidatus Acidiferrales bacterium]